MSYETIHPEHFYSPQPPERIIGTECEYNLQEGCLRGRQLAVAEYISAKKVRRIGLRKEGSFLSNGGKLYEDMYHVEYASPESLGPKEAAETDLAGIELVSRVAAASGLPHNGLFRLTGSFLHEKDKPDIDGRTSGYHENYMIPRVVSERQSLDEVIPTFLASRIWNMSGTLRDDFVFSQKVWGIGGQPITRNIERRTVDGNKPMAIIPPNDVDTVGNPVWARLEVRYADAGQSPLGRYIGFAATSMVLRLVEYEAVLEADLSGIGFKDPVYAARLFAEDLTLKKTAELNDGRFVTALDAQEILIEIIRKLADLITLPKSEIDALPEWANIVEKMRSSRPDQGEYNGLQTKLDLAAKHITLLRRHGDSNLHRNNPEAMQSTILWDRVLSIGAGRKWWQYFGAEVLDAARIRNFVYNPPNTRAKRRCNELKTDVKSLGGVDWAHVRKNGKVILMADPYSYEPY